MYSGSSKSQHFDNIQDINEQHEKWQWFTIWKWDEQWQWNEKLGFGALRSNYSAQISGGLRKETNCDSKSHCVLTMFQASKGTKPSFQSAWRWVDYKVRRSDDWNDLDNKT